jgi:hypothetical protein
VVIAIIAVLAAMLLPVLSQAKSRAQMVIDLNNVHQIMIATHMYANDNNGYLPQPGPFMAMPSAFNGTPFPASPGGTSASIYNTYYPLQVKCFKSLDSTGKPLLRNYACQFTPYLKNEKVLRCPADIPNVLMYQRGVLVTSYCWNQAVIGNGYPGWCPGLMSVTINGYSTCSTLKLSQFKADDILLFENDELNAAPSIGGWNDTVSWPDIGVSARHGKGGIVGNADGSSQWILLRDYYLMAANVPYKWTGGAGNGANRGQRMPNRVWCNPISSTGSW